MSTTTTTTPEKKYNVVNGTSYHPETSIEVINLLEQLRESRTHVIIRFGDTETGRDWMEENDCQGQIGRSMGPCKVPLLVPKRSNYGPHMLDHCIVKIIQESNGKTLYQHAAYNRPKVTIGKPDLKGYFAVGYFDGELVARFATAKEKDKWLKLMDN